MSDVGHVIAEQRGRCDRVEKVHRMHHLSDDSLCESLMSGLYPWAHITPADVRLNRRLRQSCPECVEGKMKSKPMPSSVTALATSVGEVIYFDLHELPCKSVGGCTQAIRSFDEFSSDYNITTVPSKGCSFPFSGPYVSCLF